MKNSHLKTKQIGIATHFNELVTMSFQGEMNAIGWCRNLVGNFKEIVDKIELKENITEISLDDLHALDLSVDGKLAREIILNDLRSLTEFGASPSLNLIQYYDRDDELDFISTDVYSFHVDRSPIETDTFLCTYYGATSDIVPNHQVRQKILIPEIREKLKKLYEGPDNEFESFLEEYFFDLHYEVLPDAELINLGSGHLWRLAVNHPKQKVLPCVHRAPSEEGEYRLLLIC